MAFIKQKEREKQVKKINQKYGFRKFLILAEILLIILWFVVLLCFELKVGDMKNWHIIGTDNKLTKFGWMVVVGAFIIVALGVICIVFVFTFADPYKTKNRIAKLQSSAISGKKINKEESVSKQIKDRARSQK